MKTQAEMYAELLEKLRACDEARHEAEGKGLAEVWQTCKRGDWLLWLAARMIGKEGWPTHQQVVLAACACAETALRFLSVGEDRPARAIETARKWARGEATLDEVRSAARDASYAACDSPYAVTAATAAAYTAEAANRHAAYAAYAAAAYAAIRKNTLAELANLIRSMLAVPTELKDE